MPLADDFKKRVEPGIRSFQYVWIFTLVFLLPVLTAAPCGAGRYDSMEECYDAYITERRPCQAIMKKVVQYEKRILKKGKKIAKKTRRLKVEYDEFGDEETAREAQARADLIREYEDNIKALETIMGRYNDLYMKATLDYDTCIDGADDRYFTCFVYLKGLNCPIAKAKKKLKQIAGAEDNAREQLPHCLRKCHKSFVKAMALFTEDELDADRYIQQNRIDDRRRCENYCENTLKRAERKAESDRKAFQDECALRDE